MNLAADRFYKGAFNFRRVAGNPVESVPLYSYEAAARLYDILILDGHKYYRVNMGAWANTIDRIAPAHVEIERHFSI